MSTTLKNYNESLEDIAVRLYESGKPSREVADYVGMSQPSVLKLLRARGVEIAPKLPRIKDLPLKQMIEYHEVHFWPARRIARMLKVSPSTVVQRLKGAGIKLRRADGEEFRSKMYKLKGLLSEPRTRDELLLLLYGVSGPCSVTMLTSRRNSLAKMIQRLRADGTKITYTCGVKTWEIVHVEEGT